MEYKQTNDIRMTDGQMYDRVNTDVRGQTIGGDDGHDAEADAGEDGHDAGAAENDTRGDGNVAIYLDVGGEKSGRRMLTDVGAGHPVRRCVQEGLAEVSHEIVTEVCEDRAMYTDVDGEKRGGGKMTDVGVSEPVRRSVQDNDNPCTSRSGLDEVSPGIVTGVCEDQGTSQTFGGGQSGGTVIQGGMDVNMSDQVVANPGIATGVCEDQGTS